MNERIKELAKQAGMQNTLGCFWQCSDDAIERFADLVRQDYLRELKSLKPVAWVYINEDGECEQIEYGSEGCDDPAVQPLYALDEVKHD